MCGGKGTRMQSREEKLLLKYKEPLIKHVIDALSDSKLFSKIVCVTSPNAPKTREFVSSLGIEIFDAAGDGYSNDLRESLSRLDEPDVPILIPGINDDHIGLLDVQKKNRGWKGFVAPLPNCTTTGLAITMKPLLDRFGAQKIIMTSMQAMSGAGRSPGVSALDITDNIIPYIPKEEDKVRLETGKILGKLVDGKIDPAKMKVSCTCTRVPVLDGHTESVFVETATHVDPETVKKAMKEFSSNVSVTGLPSAPKEYLMVNEDPTRPQPRLDREINEGMTTVVGRLREDTVFDNGIKYVLFSHNEKMGSAKGAVLLAEMLYKKGYI